MSAGWIVLYVIIWLVCIALVVICLGLSRRVDALERRGSAGRDVPPLPDPGARVDLSGLLGKLDAPLVDKVALVLFTSSSCAPCRELEREFAESPPDTLSDAVFIVVTDDHDSFLGPGPFSVVVDTGTIRSAFQVHMTPAAVAVSPDGMVLTAGITNVTDDLVVMHDVARQAAGGTTGGEIAITHH